MSRAVFALLLALLSAPMALANVPPLPVAITVGSPDLRVLGEGRMRWFGLHLYDAALWVSGTDWQWDSAFVLDPRTREPKLRAALPGRK